MNRSQLTLIDVLQPQRFQGNALRTRVTRTIVQPEIDAFEEQEARATARNNIMNVRHTVEQPTQRDLT